MNFLTKLDWLMKRDGLNKHTLAQRCGIPYTTIVGLFERGPENARLSTVNRLCGFFGVPLDYLALDKYERPEDFVPARMDISDNTLSCQEAELLGCYRALNPSGQGALLTTARAFASNPEMQKSAASSETA